MTSDFDVAGLPHEHPHNGRAGLRVLMTPDYRPDNPYQHLLAKALENLGANVQFPSGYRRVFPLRRMLPRSGPRPDVLHLHWIFPYLKGKHALAKAVYAAKLLVDVTLVRCTGVKLVWTVHNLVGHEQEHPGIERWARRRLARAVDSIIVHSDRARELVAEEYCQSAERICVIPHGHYRDAYGPRIPAEQARRELALPPDGQVFLFFGMIRPYKGVMKLLSAWAGSPDLQQHTLVIAGCPQDTHQKDEIERAAEGLTGVYLNLYRIPDQQVPVFFSAATTVVLPFERSLTSGSLVLARSFGCKVVTTLSRDGTYRPVVSVAADPATSSSDLARRLVRATVTETIEEGLEYPDWESVALRHLEVMLQLSR